MGRNNSSVRRIKVAIPVVPGRRPSRAIIPILKVRVQVVLKNCVRDSGNLNPTP